MNLNEIELPAFVLANLYPASLVAAAGNDAIPKVKAELPKEEIKSDRSTAGFLGNNRQYILIVVDYKDVPHIPDPELELLTGILTACKLGIDDIALVNCNNSPDQNYKDYHRQFKSRVVLLFDTSPTSIGLPLDFPQFQPQSFNGTTYLFSPSLRELGNDKILKSKLWLCLKKIFSL
jgi:hypothetical protein